MTLSYTNKWSEDASNANTEELSSAWFEEEDQEKVTVVHTGTGYQRECYPSEIKEQEELQEDVVKANKQGYDSVEEMKADTGSKVANESSEAGGQKALTFKEIEELAEEKGTTATEMWRNASKTEDSSLGAKCYDARQVTKSLEKRSDAWADVAESIREERGIEKQGLVPSSSASSPNSTELEDDSLNLEISSEEALTESELKREAARQFKNRDSEAWQSIGEELAREASEAPDTIKTMHDNQTHISITDLGDDEKRVIRTSFVPLQEELERVTKETDLVKITERSGDEIVAKASSQNAMQEYLNE